MDPGSGPEVLGKMEVIFNAPQMMGRHAVILQITVTLLRLYPKDDKSDKEAQGLLGPTQSHRDDCPELNWIIARAQLSKR